MVLMMNMIAATATTTTMMIMTMTWLRAVSLGQVGRRSRRADGFTSPRATKELFPTCGNVPRLAVLITSIIIVLMSSLASNVAIRLSLVSWARSLYQFCFVCSVGKRRWNKNIWTDDDEDEEEEKEEDSDDEDDDGGGGGAGKKLPYAPSISAAHANGWRPWLLLLPQHSWKTVKSDQTIDLGYLWWSLSFMY